MALVRCSCVVQVTTSPGGSPGGALGLLVQVPDPTCGYVVHRLGPELGDGFAPPA